MREKKKANWNRRRITSAFSSFGNSLLLQVWLGVTWADSAKDGVRSFWPSWEFASSEGIPRHSPMKTCKPPLHPFPTGFLIYKKKTLSVVYFRFFQTLYIKVSYILSIYTYCEARSYTYSHTHMHAHSYTQVASQWHAVKAQQRIGGSDWLMA